MADSRVTQYTDLQGLAALRRDARAQDPAALREAARQFESVFTRMMLESMRDASGGDPMFDSEESRFYRDMFDSQLSVEMSRGRGLDSPRCWCRRSCVAA
jgi:flagellar protein FlgJ